MKSTGGAHVSTDDGARAAHRARLYHRLQLAAHLARKQADREMTARTGLTVSQVAVLNVVAAHRDATQRVVAADLGINESAVTALVRRLESSGHLVRHGAGRAHRLALSDAGRTAVSAARRAFAPVNRGLAGDLDIAEIDDLAARLDEIAGRLA